MIGKKLIEKYETGERSFVDVDLQAVNLRLADLRNINLRHANLQDADLRDVDLQGVNFQHANLRGVKRRNKKIQKLLAVGFSNFTWLAYTTTDKLTVLEYGCEVHTTEAWLVKNEKLAYKHQPKKPDKYMVLITSLLAHIDAMKEVARD